MASPEKVFRLGIRGSLIIGISFVAANSSGLINGNEPKAPVNTAQTLVESLFETRVQSEIISDNLTVALHWIAFQRNSNFNNAIADISRIQGEILEEGKLSYIADLNTSSLDQKYAEVLYRKEANGESVILVLSQERFFETIINSAEAGRDLLIAWRKYELAKNDPRRYRNDRGYVQDLNRQAADFVDSQLARY